MAGAKIEYDERGSFIYFLLAFECLIVIPCSYYFWPRALATEQKRDKTQCHCDSCCIKQSRLRARKPWRKAKERFIKFLLLLGWSALLLTLYKVANLQNLNDIVVYDPFEILQIDPAASMAEIKKAYRRLSLVYHPDKKMGDEKMFMMISKAYAALTDEEAKKNYEVYGNPDGPGVASYGIALPSWIVHEENSVWVLGLYALVFMVCLPVAVGLWWYKSVKFNGENVLLDTTQLYYHFLDKTSCMNIKRIIMVLSTSLEFEKSNISARPTDNIEVPQLLKELPFLNEKHKVQPFGYLYSIKARALIHAHLTRWKLPENTLEEDRLLVVQKCPYLLQELIQCSSQFTLLALAGRVPRMPSLDTIENAMKLCSLIVQALWDTTSPLLQLPHITQDLLRHFITRKRNVRSIRNLAAMATDERRSMLRTLNDAEYEDVMNVISNMPVIDVQMKSEVLDEEDSCVITSGAIVTVTVTLVRRNMSTILGESGEVKKEKKTLDPDKAQLLNGDLHVKSKQRKVWEKAAKKKRSSKGSKTNKKKCSKSNLGNKGSKKSADSPRNGMLPNSKSEEKLKADTQTVKDSDESEDSDSETDTASSHSSDSEKNDSENTEVNSKNETESNDNLDDDEEWDRFQQKITKKEKKIVEKSKKSHLVHCPFFPEDKYECWWLYVTDKKRHTLVTDPLLVTGLVHKEEIDLKFRAPKAGIHTYSVIVRSDSYVDMDIIKILKLDVKEAKEIDVSKLQWDVSEEEEEKDEEESAVEDSDLASDDELNSG